MIPISLIKFQSLIDIAINKLPCKSQKLVSELKITINDIATDNDLVGTGVIDSMQLLGIFEKLPRERSLGYESELPKKITLFKEPIVNISNTEEEIIENIKLTLLSEISD